MATRTPPLTIFRATQQVARCKPSDQKLTTQRSKQLRRHGFLKHRFSSCWNSDILAADSTLIQSDFYQSAAYLSKLYELPRQRKNSLQFPYNIAADFKLLENAYVEKQPYEQLIITADNGGKVCLATVKGYNINNTLFYIPVRPLCVMLKQPERKASAELLCSVFAFLGQHMKIPNYADKSTFMNSCYSTLEEWLDDYDQDIDEDDQDEQRVLHLTAQQDGETLKAIIADPRHLQLMKERIAGLDSIGQEEVELIEIARHAATLYETYPDRHFFDEIPVRLLEPCIDERIYPDCYLSFYWNNKDDILNPQLMDYINSSLQEYDVVDLPVTYQCFNQPVDQERYDFTFIEEHMKIIIDLINFLDV